MSTTPFNAPNPASLAPLRRPPCRIRPPFNMDGPVPIGDQQPGEPADEWLARRHADRVAALLEPLDGVQLGEHDRRVIEWLADWETSVVGTVTSILYRARTAGGAW
ncbi:hypothetical protein ACIQMJ_40435 [Actinosynnema sp. NPDC091369]